MRDTKQRVRTGISMGAVLIGSVGLTDALPAAECHRIAGVETGLPVTDGCTSPIGFCSAGTIDANQGLNGHVFLSADSDAPGPATAPGWRSYAGTITISTAEGTLTGLSLGIFDSDPASSSAGAFTAFDVYTGGTGRFEGVTGQLYTGGTSAEAAIGGNFPVSGELCFAP